MSVVDAKDTKGWTPLLFAAQNGALGAMKLLVEKGAKVNAVESTNQIALHRACFSGSLECVKYLLEHGADVNHEDDSDFTPFVVAVSISFFLFLFLFSFFFFSFFAFFFFVLNSI